MPTGKGGRSKKEVIKEVKHVGREKPSSFKQLMKLAKKVQPSGLLTSTPRSIPRTIPHPTLSSYQIPLPESSKPLPKPSQMRKRKMPDEFIKLNTTKRDLETVEDQNEKRRFLKHGPRTIVSPRPRTSVPDQKLISTYHQRSMASTHSNPIVAPRSRHVDPVDEGDSSDMEATYTDMIREEERSLRVGKREDREEEERVERRRKDRQ